MADPIYNGTKSSKCDFLFFNVLSVDGYLKSKTDGYPDAQNGYNENNGFDQFIND